jgi:hypothetical protein
MYLRPFPLFGKEGSGEIFAAHHRFYLSEKIPLNPPLLKGETLLHLCDCTTVTPASSLRATIKTHELEIQRVWSE